MTNHPVDRPKPGFDPAEAPTAPPKAPTAPPDDRRRERPTPEGDGLDPTRYGDWEKNGRCIDF